MQKYFEVNEQGHNIRCKIYYKDLHTIKKVVLFVTGFAGHKDNATTARFADRILTKYKDIAVVIYNHPAHGDDVKRKLYLPDCHTYLNLVVDYIRKQYQPENIYGYGTSFGGYLILKHIKEFGNPFKKIALRCPAVNMYQSITTNIIKPEELQQIESGKSTKVGFDHKVEVTPEFLQELKNYDVSDQEYFDFADDILIIHGTKDEIIPFQLAEKFSEDTCIELAPIQNADHRFQTLDYLEEATKKVIEFFEF